jgi:release factor glutamine methyltransferase
MTVSQLYHQCLKSVGIGAVEPYAIRHLIMYSENIIDQQQVLLHGDKVVENIEVFDPLFRRLLLGEPVAYIVGKTDFYGLQFKVNPRVLIPRPETEELVSWVVKQCQRQNLIQPSIVDIGTGSGAIALALKHAIPESLVFASDIDAAALQVAEANAKALQHNLNLRLGGFLLPWLQSSFHVDFIISNPPYVPTIEALDLFFKAYEPLSALLYQPEASVFQRVLQDAHQILNPQGWIVFETDPSLIQTILDTVNFYFPLALTIVEKDINQKQRFIYIQPVSR